MNPLNLRFCWAVVASVLAGSAVHGADPLPEGTGLAVRAGSVEVLAKSPDVLLFEDFETGTIADLSQRWHDVSNRGREVLSFSPLHPSQSSGERSLQITSTLGKDTGGHLYRQLPREVDRAFARFYVRFEAEAQYVHHFVHLGGYRPATKWPQGGAGERPNGDDRFTVGIEPWSGNGRWAAPGAWHFYTYWSEMKVSAGGKYWGNSIPPVRPAVISRDQWQCVEVMVKTNTSPEARDGELALWLDGKLMAHIHEGTPRGEWTGLGFQPLTEGGTPFEGFRWRTTPELKVNFFWLLFYVTENAARQARVESPKPVNRVWFDDVVVATEYIGPAN